MAAPNRDILYDIEGAVASASYELINQYVLANPKRQRDDDELTSPRVEIQVLPGGHTGHVFVSGSKGFYDSFNGTMQALLVTERTNSPSSHSIYKSKIIQKLGDYRNFNSGSLLPYHTMVQSDYSSTAVSTEGESNYDLSGISFNFQIWIKRDAWPNES